MSKQTWIAVGVFVALLGLVFLSREKKVEVGVTSISLPKFKTEDVTALDISGPQNVSLKKSGANWLLSDSKKKDVTYPADVASITSFLDSLAKFETDALVTENTARHAELEVDDAKGIRLKVSTSKGALTELTFGKASTSGGFYVREPQKPHVFTTKGSLAYSLKKEPNGWRKRTITSGVDSEVQSLKVTHSDGVSLHLSKKDNAWSLPSDFTLPVNFRFDASAGNSVARQVVSLYAQEFIDEPGTLSLWGLEPATATLEASLKDGKTLKVLLGKSPSPEEVKRVGQLFSNFAQFDADSDGKVTQSEVVKAESNASVDVKDTAKLLKDQSFFSRIDLGGKWGSTGDGVITKDDVSSAQKLMAGVPMQLSGEAQVYLISTSAAEALTFRLNSLRDLSLTSLSSEEVEKLEISSKTQKVVLKKDGASWKVLEPKKLPDGFELGPTQVAQQLGLMSQWKAARYVDEEKAIGAEFGAPTMTVTLTRKDGTSQKVVFGKVFTTEGKGTEVYVKGALDKSVYTMSEFARSRLDQGVELFRNRPPPSMNNISGMENLPPDVRAKLEAQLRQQFGQ